MRYAVYSKYQNFANLTFLLRNVAVAVYLIMPV
jgi:hypothetical protein